MSKTETKTPKLQDVGGFDPAMMSRGAKDRVSVHMDEQAEANRKLPRISNGRSSISDR